MAYFKTKDGTDIYYKDWGPRNGQSVVLSHGWPLSSDSWESAAFFLANNGFILFCAALVIFMNAGFAMVEAGLCRQKNAVNILDKNLIVFALAATAYWFIGYKIMYNADWVIPGWFKFGGVFFDPTVTPEMVKEGRLVPSVDFLFQLAFAGTAATITGKGTLNVSANGAWSFTPVANWNGTVPVMVIVASSITWK